jgi:hypothetical protein
MNSSPITSWEGAEAYFTFADKPFVVGFIFILSVIVTVAVIGAMILHEKHSFENLKNSK